MKTLKIKLPPDLAAFVEERVAAGDYPGPDELIEAAVARLRAQSAPQAPRAANQSFDGPRFLAEMMDKLWAKK